MAMRVPGSGGVTVGRVPPVSVGQSATSAEATAPPGEDSPGVEVLHQPTQCGGGDRDCPRARRSCQ
jgi:hypothetical protein